MESAPSPASSWLCPDEAHRERLLDMDARLRRPRRATFAVLGGTLAGCAPWIGLWPIGVLATAVVGFVVADALRPRLARPEYAVAGSWAFAQVLIAAAAALTGGAESGALLWLAVPVVTLPARFGVRGMAAGVAWTGALIVLVALAVEPWEIGRGPHDTLFPISALVGVALLSTALMRSDVHHRGEAVIDGLTGMLNRRALERRLEELEGQSRVTGDPVACVVGDLDRFKAVNDRFGHAIGDAVLVDVAYRIRKELHAFDLAYRSGGEEFLVLLPGGNAGDARDLAERLRSAIAAQPCGGVDVTMSFGVAASGHGPLDADTTIAAADAALYAAKAAGRDRVVAAGDTEAVFA